jgi:hypothetical protein
MKCITYGYVVLFLIILSIVLAPLLLINEDLYMGLYGLGGCILIGYWIYGFFSDCPDGYYGNLRQETTAETTVETTAEIQK